MYIIKILIFLCRHEDKRKLKNENKLDDFASKLEIIRSKKAFNS